jgi:hypothetical protein
VINSRNAIWLNKSYGDFMHLGPDQVSYIQAKLMECVVPPLGFPLGVPPGVSPESSDLPSVPPLDPEPIPIPPPVVLPVGAPSPVVTIMGPPAFSPGAVKALSIVPPSSPQFVPPKLDFPSLDFSVLPQFPDIMSRTTPVNPEASEFGRVAPHLADAAAFVVHRDKFRAPGIMCQDTALPLMTDKPYGLAHLKKGRYNDVDLIQAVPTMMEHPIQPFNLVKEEKEEDYDQIDPIHYKDMFVVPDTFSEAWENKSLWQRMKWRYAIKLELMKMDRMKVWQRIKKSLIPK